ncbi:3-oxoadipate enol-lactonase [Nocardia sp. CC227C]|uniref:3-oxoadipate enol-lactonase n=1 Tax=Nocardia sp. CC227C TaxID=3044562 RepID=UPI00278C00AC|nr:3-oxoadipate enol-lactonase [Nocardia sp. CC227C]
MSDLFGPLQAAGPVAAATDDTAWLQALLDAEAALARAQADTGLIPPAHAAAIAAACRADLYDPAELGAAATAIGNPAAPLVRALTARVADAEAAGRRSAIDELPPGSADTAVGSVATGTGAADAGVAADTTDADAEVTATVGAAAAATTAARNVDPVDTAPTIGGAAGSVHVGATSQDIMDTAAMLVADRALAVLLDDVAACADRLAELAVQHARTPQVGRSLLQQALPVTFGFTAAGWLAALRAASAQLDRVRRKRLAAQLGGAVGTLAALGDSGPEVLAAYARRLGLPAPELPWHTDRTRIAELAGALGTLAGATAKIARDITLLAQTEVGEVSEYAAGAGGSSTMPHKHNPIAAVTAAAGAAQAPGLVATLLAAGAQEHQRAAGSWHAEWRPLTELLRSTGAAVHWLRTSLSRLRIHPKRMRDNLTRTGGLLLAERVTTALTPVVGRLAAHDAVTACAARAAAGEGEFAHLLAAHPLLAPHLDLARVEALLEPASYLGSTATFVRRAVTAHDADRARVPRWPRDAEGESAADAGGAAVADRTRARGAAHAAAPTSVRVHSYVHGDPDGVPLVLLNALGSDASIWDVYVQPLVDNGFRVIRYDMRGHGDSPVPEGPYALADLGADVEALLDRLGVAAAHLTGISLGGMAALWLARHRPRRVRGLVVCCTSARPGNAAMWSERAALARTGGMRAIAAASVERWFTPDWRASHPETAERMRRLTADTPAEGYAACCAALSGLDLTDALPHITAPTLVIAAAADPAFPPEHGRWIADRIPGARLEIIDAAAHLGTVERPDRFLPLIIDQLRTNP